MLIAELHHRHNKRVDLNDVKSAQKSSKLNYLLCFFFNLIKVPSAIKMTFYVNQFSYEDFEEEESNEISDILKPLEVRLLTICLE